MKGQASPKKYIRRVSFPDGEEYCTKDIEIIPAFFLRPKSYPWQKALYELPERELIDIGSELARLALGEDGLKKFLKLKQKRRWQGLNFIEGPKAPEAAALPWELINIDDEFISLNPRTPATRSIDGYDQVEALNLNRPLKMALISAAPSGLDRLMVETEQIRFALSIKSFISQGKIEVHEIINCTRDKLNTALRNNRYVRLSHLRKGVNNGYNEQKR